MQKSINKNYVAVAIEKNDSIKVWPIKADSQQIELEFTLRLIKKAPIMPTFRANIWSFGQFAILIFLEHFSVSSSESPLPCAILFSERNFEGIPILVNHQGQVSDLQEDSRISGLTANKWETKSVQVFSGCNLRACNDSYFDGACDTFKEGSYPGLSEQNISDTRLISDILSIQCTCKQVG